MKTPVCSTFKTRAGLLAAAALLALAWPASAQYNLTLQVMGSTITSAANLNNLFISGIGTGGALLSIIEMPTTPTSSSCTVTGSTATGWSIDIGQVPAGLMVDTWTLYGAGAATFAGGGTTQTGGLSATVSGISATQATPVQILITFKAKQVDLTLSLSNPPLAGTVTVAYQNANGSLGSAVGQVNAGTPSATWAVNEGSTLRLTPPTAPVTAGGVQYIFSHFGVAGDQTTPHPAVSILPAVPPNVTTYTIAMNADQSVVAVFSERLTIVQNNWNPNNAGAIPITTDVVKGQANVLVAPPANPVPSTTPNVYYFLKGWSAATGDFPTQPSGLGTSVTIPQIVNGGAITWEWEMRYAMDVFWMTPGGSVQVDLSGGFIADFNIPPNPHRYWFRPGDTTTLRANSQAGYAFGGWTSSKVIAQPNNPSLAIPGGLTPNTALTGAAFTINAEFMPISEDTNGDGIPDWWSILTGLDPFVPRAEWATNPSGPYADPDNDGLMNIEEYRIFFSNQSVFVWCDPLNWNTSGDLIDDGWKTRMFALDPEYQANIDNWIPPALDDGMGRWGTPAPEGRYGPYGNPSEVYLWNTGLQAPDDLYGDGSERLLPGGWEMVGVKPHIPGRPLTNWKRYNGPDDQPPKLAGAPIPVGTVGYEGITRTIYPAVNNALDTRDDSNPLMVSTANDGFDDGFKYSWDRWQRFNGNTNDVGMANLRMTDRAGRGGNPPVTFWPGITQTVTDMVGGSWPDVRPFHPRRAVAPGGNISQGVMYDIETGRPNAYYTNVEKYNIWETWETWRGERANVMAAFPNIPMYNFFRNFFYRRDDKPVGSSQRWCTNPFLWDTDNDGLPDGWEVSYGYNPWKMSTDNSAAWDSQQNPCFATFAYDRANGLRHNAVYQAYGFNPGTSIPEPVEPPGINRIPPFHLHTAWYTNIEHLRAGLLYDFEIGGLVLTNQFNPANPADRLTNWYSTNPWTLDADGDGMYDTWELYVGLNPWDFGVDGPIMRPGGLSNFEKFDSAMTPPPPEFGPVYMGIYPELPVGYRVPGWFNKSYPCDPADPDTDNDQVSDGGERASFNAEAGEDENGEPRTPPAGGWVTYSVPSPANYPPAAALRAEHGGLCPTSVDTSADGLPDGWMVAYGAFLHPDDFAANAAGGTNVYYYAQGRFGGISLIEDPFAMNGTMKCALLDPTGGGLMNYQKYMMGAVGHWQFQNNVGLPLWFGMDPPASVPNAPATWYDPYNFFDPAFSDGGQWTVGWGGREPYAWDPRYVVHPILAPYRYRFMTGAQHITGLWYSTGDPLARDTAVSGVDDYWKVFHGLNPLMGFFDVVRSKVYGARVFGTEDMDENDFLAVDVPPDLRLRPWLAGAFFTDSDGDGLSDIDESLQANIYDPKFYNTDPSPLWMTDISYENSWVNRFYWPGSTFGRPGLNQWLWPVINPPDYLPFVAPSHLFSFEMNEGFDTDGNFINDRVELVGNKLSPGVSDPLNPLFPNRRRALYLEGEASAARTMPQYAHGTWDLRQFTVEAWVRPEEPARGYDQVVVERVGDIPQGSVDQPPYAVRANFRLGIDKDGYPFIEYNGQLIDDLVPNPRATSKEKLVANRWYHLSATYGGQTQANGQWKGELKLYVDGASKAAEGSNEIPMNGHIIPMAEGFDRGYYIPMPIVLGARDLNPSGWVAGSPTVSPVWVGPGAGITYTTPNLTDFYKGHIDQVRIWRTPLSQVEINKYMKHRHTSMAEIKRLATAPDDVDDDGKPGMGLLYLYTFDNVPDPVNSDIRPDGFDALTSRPLDYSEVPFWGRSPMRSRVYTDYRILPWIKNLVAHVPLSKPRNMGYTPPDQLPPDHPDYSPDVSYPNSANPYGFVYITSPTGDAAHPLRSPGGMTTLPHQDFLGVLETQANYPDLLPLLWAYTDERVVMWDGKTGIDPDIDSDGDGLPDWWEEMYGLDPNSQYTYGGNVRDGDIDMAKDGVHNSVKFRLGLDPRISQNNTVNGVGIDDYDWIAMRLDAFNYLSFDWMERWWKVRNSSFADPDRYCPHWDRDGDGWDNWSECRARTNPGAGTGFDVNGPRREYPEPILGVTIFSESMAGLPAGTQPTIVIQGYGTPTMDGVPDAKYSVTLNQRTAVNYAVEVNGLAPMHMRMLPGHVYPGTISFTAMMYNTQGAPMPIEIIDLMDGQGAGTGTLIMTEATTGMVLFWDIGTVNYMTGEYTLDLTDIVGSGSMGLSYDYWIIPNWPTPITFWVKEPDSFSYGLRQGYNYFFAFLDTNGSGEWEPGKPAAIAEQNLRAPAASNATVSGKGLSGHYIGWHENDLTFGLRDARHGYPRFAWPATGNDTIVQISRTSGASANLLNTITIRAPRNYIHEGDILFANRAKLGTGLDWGFGGGAGLTNTYSIVAINAADNTQIATTSFIYGYPSRGSSALTPAPTYPKSGAVMERSELEFRWEMPVWATGFQLVICRGTSIAPGVNGANVVYNSGVLPPAALRREVLDSRTIVCTFTPELYANELAPNTDYTWQVFTFTPTTGQVAYNNQGGGTSGGVQAAGNFVIPSGQTRLPSWFRVTDQLGSHSETFSINVDVSFFTPNTGSTGTRTVYVEAFRNAGFTGMPAARTSYTFANTATRPVKRNVTLAGLDSKMSYYIRAYVRTNSGDGNATRQLYDPWGYVCEPLRDGWRYDPMRIADIRPVLQPYVLKIYATDVNQNKIADIDTRDGGIFSPMEGSLLGGEFSTQEFAALLDMIGDVADTTGSGLPDSLEANLGIGNHTSGGISADLLGDLGLVPADPLKLVISGIDGATGIQWTLGTDSVPGPFEPMGLGNPGGFTPMSASKSFKSQVLYIVERTDKLGAEADWKPVKAFFSSAPLGSVTLPVDTTKSSGFYRVKLIELPKK